MFGRGGVVEVPGLVLGYRKEGEGMIVIHTL